jgi:DNA-binding LytR/AlgR family response regulator
MPEINGFDLACEIWKRDADAHVCFLTAFDIYENEADKVFKDFSSKCFVKKPITAKQLAQHLKRHLKPLDSS